MEKVVALFIGGPFDGLRREVFRGQDYVEVAALPLEPARLSTLGQMPRNATVKSAVYRRYPFSSDRVKDVGVYVHGDGDPLLMLLNGYHHYSGADPL